jgi:hypothetical protein
MIGNGGFGEVFIQDTTQPLFQFFLQREQKTDITLTSPISIDDETISVSTGHGFTGAADEIITIVEGEIFEQASVLSPVVGDDISIAIPSANAFTTNAKIIRGNKNLNENGSVTPVEAVFRFYDQSNTFVPIDISKVAITMSHSTAGDDGKFGGLSVLTGGGFYFRRVNADRINLGNYINNQAFKDFGASVEYTAKGPGGLNATNILFDVKTIFGQVIRLNPQHNDQVCGVNRNDLGGLSSFYVSLVGSFTAGES